MASNLRAATAPMPMDDQSAAESAATGAFPVTFSESAVTKIKDLLSEENNPGLKLRVFVAGGGCSGFQYGFTFDEAQEEDDMVLDKEGITVLVDAMSLQYLDGAEVDYQERLEGSQFVISNPNVTSTCGCGSSFSV